MFDQRNQLEGGIDLGLCGLINEIEWTCNFGAVLLQYLRDKLVCGLTNTSSQKRLLQEDNLTFKLTNDKAIALAIRAKRVVCTNQPPKFKPLRPVDLHPNLATQK